MTWLSRLLPQTPGRQHRSTPLHRTTKQRRRMMTLENLEQRVVLSDVSAMYIGGNLYINTAAATTPPVGPPALIGNRFTIAESSAVSGGTVKVTSNSLATTVNGVSGMGALAYTTPGPVSNIFVNVTAATPNPGIVQTIALTGAGKTTATTVKDVTFTVDTAKLELTVSKVDNKGSFKLSTNGGLDAKLSESSFAAMTINQTSDACCGKVLLDNVNVSGAVSITEGNAAGNSIIIQNGSTLGSTVLKQGNGAGDVVKVLNSSVNDLQITQGNGAGDNIVVDTVKIGSVGKTTPNGVAGVITTQGNGDGDTTTINAVTLANPNSPPNFSNPMAPPAMPSIIVNQGTGNNDDAKVTNSNVPGVISITQNSQSSPTNAHDTALIADSTAGFLVDLSMYGLGVFRVNGDVSISQWGTGLFNTAFVERVVANSVNVRQGDGDEANAHIINSQVYESAKISQGNGGDVIPAPPLPPDNIGDIALIDHVYGRPVTPGPIDPSLALTGNIEIAQGTGNGDQATITSANTKTDVKITQNGGNWDVARIGRNSNGKVTAVGNISIDQTGGNNLSATIENVDPADIWIHQGAGNDQTATINNVTTLAADVWIHQDGGSNLDATISNITVGADDVSIEQGAGSGNDATITTIAAAGDLWITQDVGDGNDATIEHVAAATGDASISQIGAGNTATVSDVHVADPLNGSNPLVNFSSISIEQQGGDHNTATIDGSSADGNLSITQDTTSGLGSLDVATISNSNAGTVVAFGPYVLDLNGNASITQGDGYAVTANFFGLHDVNNIYATQGDNVYDPTCDPGYYDTVLIDDSTVTSDIVVVQGASAAAAGGYYTSIGDLGTVTAGGFTDIHQLGVGNYVVFGGFGGSFTTNYLDVFTGDDFGTVMAANTTVLIGALGTYGSTTINGDGLNNTYYDAGGNTGVTVATNFNLS